MTTANGPLPFILQLRQDLAARFPERREVIDGALCAVLAGEHVLLLGPPGTAKSALVRAIAQAFGGRYFERLLTKFSTPEELFGPISLAALEQDRYARVVTGKLPEAEFAFADEIFKANSAILNSLLTLVNERVFHNDGAPMACPLVSLFGASNELPEGKELEALFDRFLLRYDVQYLLSDANMLSMLRAPDPTASLSLSLEVLRAAQAAVRNVTISDATLQALLAIRSACKADGIDVSDRRWKKSLKAVQATAYLAGADCTSPEDLVVLSDSLWREPKERPKIARLVGHHADPIGAKAAEILDAAREEAARVAGLRASATQKHEYVSAGARALEAFDEQKRALEKLAAEASARSKATIANATQEILQLRSELARSLSDGLRLGR